MFCEAKEGLCFQTRRGTRICRGERFWSTGYCRCLGIFLWTACAAISGLAAPGRTSSWEGEHWGLRGPKWKASTSRWNLLIRSLRVPYPMIQTVVLQNVRHLIPSTNAVTIASGNFVFGLFPVPFGAQIVQLTASGDFEEAMALCKLLPPEDSSLRAVKEGSIHISLLKFTLIYIYKHPNIVYIIQRRIYQLMATEFSKFSVLPELFNMTIAFWQFRRLLN